MPLVFSVSTSNLNISPSFAPGSLSRIFGISDVASHRLYYDYQYETTCAFKHSVVTALSHSSEGNRSFGHQPTPARLQRLYTAILRFTGYSGIATSIARRLERKQPDRIHTLEAHGVGRAMHSLNFTSSPIRSETTNQEPGKLPYT